HVLAAVPEDALHEVADAGPGRRARAGELLVDDHVVHARQLLPADTSRPRQPEEPGVVERLMPGRLPGPVLVGGRRRGQAGIAAPAPPPAGAPEPPPRRPSQQSPCLPLIPLSSRTRPRLGPPPPRTSIDSGPRRR